MEKRKLITVKLETDNEVDSAYLETTDDDLTTLQQFVGGYIEIVRIAPDAVMIVNDEGLLRDLPINVAASLIYGGPIAGNAWIFGIDSDGELQDVPERYFRFIVSYMAHGLINNEKEDADDEQ